MNTKILVTAIALVALPAFSTTVVSDDLEDDFTSKIVSAAGLGNTVWRPVGVNYVAYVTLYTNGTEGWAITPLNATLHVSVEGTEVAAIDFVSGPNGALPVSIPVATIHGGQPGPRLVTLVVEATDLGKSSNHNIVRSQLIDRGLFAQADALDGVGTPIVAAGA